jgi:hypothetical protein
MDYLKGKIQERELEDASHLRLIFHKEALNTSFASSFDAAKLKASLHNSIVTAGLKTLWYA